MATPSEKTNGLCDFGDNLTTCLGAKSNNKQMDKVLNLYTKKNPARPIKTIAGSCNKVMDIGLKASDKGTSASVQDGVKDAAGDEPPLEDDVPPNFFDDFMSEDFIDGLNVVDTWDEEESKKTSTTEQRKGKRSALKRSSSPKPRRSDSRKQIRSRSPRYRRSSDRKRSTSKDKDRERRDPTKTQRDILRDKDRCAKDQKAKLISEKLRMVETGLVPPGMEMEVDIQLPSSQIESRLQKIRRSVERKRSPVEFDRRFTRFSPEKNRRSLTRRTRMSPPRYPRSRSRSPRRKMERRSIERRPENRSLERYVDERGMERRIEERSMERRMEVRRNMEERRENRRRSPSRSPKRRRSKTPQSDLSDRERWLRHRSRSRSPRRNKSFLQELNAKLTKPSAKKSFLKELKETMNKSNEMQTQPTVVTRRPHHSHYLPTPVPPPQNFIPQTLIVPPQQEYDQQFFIGQSELPGPPGFMHPMGVAAQDMVPMHMPYVVEAPPPQPVPMPDYIPLATHTQQAKPSAPIMGKKTLSKLFNDEKITLSDYLSLTGKFTDESRPVNIQNKIKVISDCQDIIKELSAEAKASGHFTVRKVAKPAEKVLDTKHQSPFKKIPVVRFQYTTRTKPSDEKPTMASLLTKLLHRFGKEYTIEEAPKQSPVVELSSSTQSPPAPSTIHEDEKKAYMASKSTKTMFCQTDRFQCRDCEKKSSKVTLHKMIQTGDLLTFDVGCQVGPDDFVKSPAKGILKNNQSLASMTPAQLLAEARGETPPLAYSKHSFDSPSEPKRPNRDSFNDDDGYQGRFSRSHDFDNFDRYRGESERLKGPALFERDRVGSSAGTRENYPVGRAEAFGSVARTGSFGYQPKQATSWQGIEPAFSSRPEKENPQFNAPGRPAFNQPGQMPYRDSGPRLNANPVGGTFNHGSRF